jgi:type I restriction enzyme S subunit
MTQSNLTFKENYEIPQGLKKTELGFIPEDWQIYKLSEIIKSIQLGGNYPNSLNEKGFPLIKMGNLNRGSINLDKIEFIQGEYNQRDKLNYGDLLFNTRNTPELVGKVAIWRNELPIAYFNSNIMRIKFRGELVSNNFYINYAMNTKKFIDTLSLIATGTTSVAAIYTRDLLNLSLVLPPCTEQEKIATALSDTDALISELEKLIEKKQAIKTATMQQLLTGKTRLPEFTLREDGTPKAYKNSELGQIPEDWDVYKVGEISDVLTGFPFPSSHYTDSGVRLLRGSNVKRGVTDWSEDITQYWPIISSDIKKYELKVGDIVISMDGSLVGRSFAQLDKSDLPAVLLQRVARVRSSDVDQNYLKQWICSEMFTAHCDAVKTVTAIPHISPDDIKTFRFVAPKCKKEQKQLSGILKDMEVEIQILNEKLTKLIMFKKGMMQELLTGKTRLV